MSDAKQKNLYVNVSGTRYLVRNFAPERWCPIEEGSTFFGYVKATAKGVVFSRRDDVPVESFQTFEDLAKDIHQKRGVFTPDELALELLYAVLGRKLVAPFKATSSARPVLGEIPVPRNLTLPTPFWR